MSHPSVLHPGAQSLDGVVLMVGLSLSWDGKQNQDHPHQGQTTTLGDGHGEGAGGQNKVSQGLWEVMVSPFYPKKADTARG